MKKNEKITVAYSSPQPTQALITSVKAADEADLQLLLLLSLHKDSDELDMEEIRASLELTKEELVSFVESAMMYSLSFDLLVPPFDLVKVASVEQINAKIESARMRTGKRMGYKYNSDDVLEN
jgi:hypothetical protein